MGKGKRRSKSKSKQAMPPRSRWPKALLPGALGLAVVVGVAAWFFFQQGSPGPVAPEYRGGPRLRVDRDYVDLGTVRFDSFVTARFSLRNVGDQPLSISANPKVDAVEGC
jgi:hypothetical protein